MVEAAVAAALIAARGLPTPHPACVDTTVSGAVDLASVAVTADQDLPAAKGAEKEATARAFIEVAPESHFSLQNLPYGDVHQAPPGADAGDQRGGDDPGEGAAPG